MWNPDLFISTSVLLLAVLLLRQPVAKYFGPKAAYLLWLAPGLRLLTPTLPALFSLSDVTRLSQEQEQIIPQMTPVPLEESFSELVQYHTLEPATKVSVSEFLPWIWLAGFSLCLMVMIIRQMRFQAALRPLKNNALRQRIESQATELGLYAPRALTGIDTPMTTGLTSPAIILPENFAEQYSPTEQQYIIDHELLHIRRKDLWAKGAALIFCALNWFNPMAWYALTRFEADQEAACDADLLAYHKGARKSYAELLFKVSHPQSHRTLLTLEAGGFLQNRLSQISRSTLSRSRQKVGGFVSILLAAGLVMSTAQYAQAKTERSEKPELEFGFVRGFDELKIVNFISSDGPMSPAEERSWLDKLDTYCPDFKKTLERDGFQGKINSYPRTMFVVKVNQQAEKPKDSKGYLSFSCVSGPNSAKIDAYLAAIGKAKESLPEDIRTEIPLAQAAYSYLENLENNPEYLSIPRFDRNGELMEPIAIVREKEVKREFRTRTIIVEQPEVPEGTTFIPTQYGRENYDFKKLMEPTSDPVIINDCGDKNEITWKIIKKPEDEIEVRQELCVDSDTYNDKEKLKTFLREGVASMTNNPSMKPEYRSIILEQLKTKANQL